MSELPSGPYLDILSNEFARQAAEAGNQARLSALAKGIPVTYLDQVTGLNTMEFPDGRTVEIEWISGAPRHQNFRIVRELTKAPAA